MMKKITFLLALLTCSLGFSQTELLTNGDFSNGGANWAFDGGGSVVGGEAVFPATAATGNPWDTQLVQGSLSFTAGQEYTLTFKARAAAARDITVAIQNVGIWNDQFRQNFSITTTMSTYTATFNAAATNSNVQIGFLMANFGVTDAVYFDDISLTTPDTSTCNNGVQDGDETGVDCGGSCTPCLTPPTVAAPTPPARAAADVISIYSGAYAAIPGIDLDQGWCDAGSVTETTAGGDAILAYNDKPCQGIDFDANRQDFTGITNLHVDLFIMSGTDLVGKVFNVKIVPDSGAESVFPIDINGLNPKPVPGTWFSYDMPITISGPHSSIRQVGVTSNFVNTLWYDNLYFHKNTTLSTKKFEIAGLTAYPNPTQDSWTVKTQNIKMSTIQVFDILGKQVLSLSPNASEAKIDASALRSGLYFAKISTADGSSSLKLVRQ
ncbi:MAG TPA: T9SS type A sorting domain-containing protein [Yeosuana sp.]